MSRRLYTADFKAAAARLVTEQGYGNLDGRHEPGGAPQHHAALGPPPRPAAGPRGPAARRPRRPQGREPAGSARRTAGSSMEREILKKATAFFASERA